MTPLVSGGVNRSLHFNREAGFILNRIWQLIISLLKSSTRPAINSPDQVQRPLDADVCPRAFNWILSSRKLPGLLHVIRLTDTWLNNSCFNCSFFPDKYLVYTSDRISSEKASGRVGGANRRIWQCLRHYTYTYNWPGNGWGMCVDISTSEGFNMYL